MEESKAVNNMSQLREETQHGGKKLYMTNFSITLHQSSCAIFNTSQIMALVIGHSALDWEETCRAIVPVPFVVVKKRGKIRCNLDTFKRWSFLALFSSSPPKSQWNCCLRKTVIKLKVALLWGARQAKINRALLASRSAAPSLASAFG